jgi:cardiolipin synthase A/B
MSSALAAALAVAATLVVVFFWRNLASGEKKIQHEIEPLYPLDSDQFRRVLSSLLGPPIVAGNRVRALQNGDEIFPPMLAAIREAEKTVCFETFIYWSGEIARELSEALAERARAGVRVHVLLDWLGSKKLDETLIAAMEEAGVEVERYHPVRWYHLGRLNHRTHRKLLVVDGRVGFTGGVGIGDEWLGHAQDPDHWRDVHFRVEGPVVAHLQAAFMDNWLKTRARVLHGAEYFPPLAPVGDVDAQMFRSSPREGSESVRLMYLLAIAAAREEILMANAYFVPDDLAREELVAAARRGVRVRIVVPGRHIDADLVRFASRARWGPLLEAGVEIHEFQPTMYHCKVFIADRLLVSVGSTNFDNRSFRLNDEANLNLFDREFAAAMSAVIEADLARSRQLTFEQWRHRPWREKVADRASALLRSQL